jgi:hypothetical protein
MKLVRDLSEDHMVAIARTVLEVSRFEWLLSQSINVVFKLAGKGDRAKLKKLRHKTLVDEAKDYLLFALPQRANEIDDLFTRIEAVRTDRHAFVHDLWGQGYKDDEAANFNANPFEDAVVAPIHFYTPAQIEAVGDRAEAICTELIALSNTAHHALAPRIEG